MKVNLIRAAMVKEGMTQLQLAKMIGISKQTMTRRMSGKSPFTVDEIDAICQALKINDLKTKADIFLATNSH